MKTRLAKKICSVPIDRISPYWFHQCRGGRDTRIETAMKLYNKRRHGVDKER